jgi:hypothetical protein
MYGELLGKLQELMRYGKGTLIVSYEISARRHFPRII